MPKRGNGEGSVYRTKSGLWRDSYWVATAKGLLKRRYVSGKTRQECARKRTKAMADREGGLIFDASALTVGEYLDRWLADVRDRVRESTHEGYEYAIGPHIKPALGRIKLKDLNPAQIRWFYRDRLDAGLAPATVHKQHVVLHKALKAAVADGLRRSPAQASSHHQGGNRSADGRTVPPTPGGRTRRAARSPLRPRSQYRHAAGRAPGPQVGGRRSRGRASASAPYPDARGQSDRPRGAEGEEQPPHHPAHQGKSLYQPGGLIFATEAGTIINPSNLRNRSFKPLLKRAGLPPVRFHDLRHTCATLLLSKNVNPKVVSEMLGHSSISITLDIYSHLLPDMQEKAVVALEELLS